MDFPVRMHDLRHAHASWLLAGGADLAAVMERMGHAQIMTTPEIPPHPARRRRQGTRRLPVNPRRATQRRRRAPHLGRYPPQVPWMRGLRRFHSSDTDLETPSRSVLRTRAHGRDRDAERGPPGNPDLPMTAHRGSVLVFVCDSRSDCVSPGVWLGWPPGEGPPSMDRRPMLRLTCASARAKRAVGKSSRRLVQG
ncbi:tyrosine-type recombinase/integrase [Cellulomonas sp. KRMCY2]|uniref:tyrosine-type recombinase/integrase n=1 Tax=Cellulomonas sp. KRMCY2 TaxID=1304865 RepID=UPI0021012F5E|nr:tyrosine-type recombinase/integrase [Cellulomonas sp. KRMCY2]